MNFLKKHHLIFALTLIAALTVSRFLPHPPNFTPVIAMALFSGAVITGRFRSTLIPMLAMAISDFMLNRAFYPEHSGLSYFTETPTFGVYLGIALSALLGSFLGKGLAWNRILGFTISSSLSFWVITNFFCWPANPLYSQDLQGLLNCYTAAIPFLSQTIGDIFFSTLLFGVWKWTYKSEMAGA